MRCGLDKYLVFWARLITCYDTDDRKSQYPCYIVVVYPHSFPLSPLLLVAPLLTVTSTFPQILTRIILV